MDRRHFVAGSAAALAAASLPGIGSATTAPARGRKPNVLFLLTDEWRAQATGYAGDANVRSPTFDRLAAEGANCVNAISGLPLCCPARASLMTGQYPLKHGVFINDVPLEPNAPTLGQAFKQAGYRTGYIGKWHLHGSPDGHYGRRDSYIPANKHFGFDYWKASECDHDYNDERYFVGDDPTRHTWPGYAPTAQTDDACRFITDTSHGGAPFFLTLSVGPPHFPYATAPEQFKTMFAGKDIALRPNVPPALAARATETLRGYYAHIAALDACLKRLLDTLEAAGIADDTIVVFSADHGDMLFSQGLEGKLYPWDESIRIPLVVRYPRKLGRAGRRVTTPMSQPDIMPTLLGLADLPIPKGIQGIDFSTLLATGSQAGAPRSAFIDNPVSNFQLRQKGFDSYRGVRTERYTYIRAITGPWLLYDNRQDPFQKHNLIGTAAAKEAMPEVEAELAMWLKRLDDRFLPGDRYLAQANLGHYYEVKTPIGAYSSPWGDWGPTMHS